MTLRLLFAFVNAYPPDSVGGSQRSVHTLCAALLRRGVPVAVAAALAANGKSSAHPSRKKFGEDGYVDEAMGYPVFRLRQVAGGLGETAAAFGASVVVAQNVLALASAAIQAGFPAILHLRNADLAYVFGGAAPHPGLAGLPVGFAANSDFIAGFYEPILNRRPPIVYPAVDADAYRTPTAREILLFVNPVPAKGLDMALRLAKARPDIPFEILENWPLAGPDRAALIAQIQGLPNLRFRPPVADMREVYAKAKLLLVPSRWQEAWARVVTEAQVSGIPALASRIGGLPESVGSGGILVGPGGGSAEWENALARLWDDPEAYEKYSRAALAESRRAELQPDRNAAALLELAERQAERRAQSGPAPAAALRILFVTDHGYLPDYTGGAEQGTHALCLALQRRGVAVAVLAKTATQDRADWRRPGRALFGHWGYREDREYPVYRLRDVADPISLAAVAGDFRPSVAVIQPSGYFPLARDCAGLGLPTVIYFRDVQLGEMRLAEAKDFNLENPLLAYLANSPFVAGRLAKIPGISPHIVPALVRPEDYRVETSRRRVLFVNPVPVKGVDIALRLASARPDIPFDFIEAWPLSSSEFEELGERCRKLGNVRLRRAVPDMRPVYAETKLLLVPSRWEEATARVVAEAQISGIPVLGSRIGGLPDSVGPGGILADPGGDFGEWVEALSLLWDDKAAYERYAEAALAHSRRAEIDPDRVIGEFLAFVQAHAARFPARAAPPRKSPMDVGLDIVVPTYRRPGDLARALESLRPQVEGHPNRRVTVVNDASHDERYQAVIERHRDIADYVVAPVNGGPSASRNLGAARTSKEVLVFIDDDCAAPPYWLDWLCAVMAESPDADVIGGTTRPLPSQRPEFFEKFLGEAGFHPLPIISKGQMLLLVTASLAIRRSRFQAVGGFDEALRLAEDRNLTYRLGVSRAIVHFDAGWFVYHDMTSTMRAHFRRYYRYGVGLRRELEFEESPPDALYWPPAERPFGYWLKRAALFRSYARDKPEFRLHAWPVRAIYRALFALTLLVMDWGFVRGAPPPRYKAREA
jgi:glycosyltransferase involved in cell wall biosynthesis/GT2 family glycosyltransferase